MSLSKYYKKSSSFQPEEILKQKEKTATGWQSTSRQKPVDFEQQKTLTEELPRDNLLPSTENGDTSTSAPTPESQEEIGGSGKPEDINEPGEPATTEKIDLSKYTLLSEMEKKVAEAYQKGVEDGLQKVDQDYAAAAKMLQLVCQQLDEIRNTIINNSSREFQEFALAIAERILRISVAEQDETIIATIEEALHRAVRSDEFIVYIHPDDYATVSNRSEDLMADISGLTNLVIKRDITVERGGARIESENCTIDATIASQFDTIRDAVKNQQ